MTDSEHHDDDQKPTGLFRSRRHLLTLAAALVVAIAWIASLLWVRSFSVTHQAGGTSTATATPSPTATDTTASPIFVYVTVTATPAPAPTVTATVTKPIQVAPMGVLGPTGYRRLELGMS